MWVVESDVQKPGFVLLGLHKELLDQAPDERDVPAHLVDGVVLFRVREGERVGRLRPDVLLANDACPVVASLVEDEWQTLDGVEGLEVVVHVVEAVHAVLVLWEAGEDGGEGGGTGTGGGEGVSENEGSLCELIEVRSLALVVAVGRCFETHVICNYQQHILFLVGIGGPWGAILSRAVLLGLGGDLWCSCHLGHTGSVSHHKRCPDVEGCSDHMHVVRCHLSAKLCSRS